MRKFIYLLLIFCFALVLSGCSRQRTIILFNKNPITKETLLNNSTLFDTQKRIYYIFISEKQINTKFVRVIIQKREDKANFVATKVVYSNDFRLSKDQVYYFTDYIVMHDAGYYCMKIYPTNDLSSPIAVSDFQVKN